MQAASRLWELHIVGLQQREQQLQEMVDELHGAFKQEQSVRKPLYQCLNVAI